LRVVTVYIYRIVMIQKKQQINKLETLPFSLKHKHVKDKDKWFLWRFMTAKVL